MQYYKFIIGITGTRGITQELEQKLLEAGCEDVELATRRGEVLLFANRPAKTFALALELLENQINSIELENGKRLSVSSYRISAMDF